MRLFLVVIVRCFLVFLHFREGHSFSDIVLDALLDGFELIELSQLIQAEVFLAMKNNNGMLPRSACICLCLDLIAHFFHHADEIPLRGGSKNCTVNIRADRVSDCRLSILFSNPLPIILLFPFRILNHRDPRFTAQPI